MSAKTLRPAERQKEIRDHTHPFHLTAIEHQDKILDYLTD